MNLATEKRRPRAPSTDCCLGILEALSQHPEGLTLSDLHRLLDVSKNMAFRILTDMSDRGPIALSPAHENRAAGQPVVPAGRISHDGKPVTTQ